MLKVFLTNLGKYNEGELVGKWVSLPCDDLEAELEEIGVGAEPYEEYFITDYESDIGITIGEYTSVYWLNELAERLDELDDDEAETVKAYLECESNDIEEAIEALPRCAFYQNTTLEDMAQEDVEAMNLPEIALRYFDYEAYARDMNCNGYTEVNGGVFYRW